MPYDNIITRSETQALIPEQTSTEILKNLENMSAAMNLFRRIPMSTNQTRMPVLAALPTAYFVNGDTGLKQTTEVNWANKFLNVEELAAIVPIPENVLDDASYDVWGTIRPLLEQAIARALDAAIFFGTNKPGSWPNAIVTDAIAAGNTYNRGTNAAAAGGVAQDLSELFTLIESDGFDVNGIAANRAYRGRLRGARDSTGVLLAEVSPASVYGVNVGYPMRGQWPTGSGAAEVIAGDFMEGILGTRKDFTYKILDQAVIQNSDGTIMYNFAQQDMVGLRVTFRCAFQLANTINYDQPIEAQRYPFGVLRAP